MEGQVKAIWPSHVRVTFTFSLITSHANDTAKPKDPREHGHKHLYLPAYTFSSRGAVWDVQCGGEVVSNPDEQVGMIT